MSDPIAEDRRLMAVSFMTTEHFVLQGYRGMTINESNGRAGLFLSSLSSALVALGFAATASNFGQSFSVFALLILPPLAFLGFITFQRTIQSGIDDALYSRGINRIRHFYVEMVPEITPYLIRPEFDDRMTAILARSQRRVQWQSFLTIASVVGVMNSAVIGAAVGIFVNLPDRPDLPFALVVGVSVSFVAALAHAAYQIRQWKAAFVIFATMFSPDAPETPA